MKETLARTRHEDGSRLVITLISNCDRRVHIKRAARMHIDAEGRLDLYESGGRVTGCYDLAAVTVKSIQEISAGTKRCALSEAPPEIESVSWSRDVPPTPADFMSGCTVSLA